MTLISINLSAQERAITNTSSSPYAKLISVNIDDVQWTDGFWAKKFALIRDIAVPNMWDLLSDPDIGHAYQNFLIAGGKMEGAFKGTWWHDGDFYKWLEAASYVYSQTQDKELDQLMDKAIEAIAAAQHEDGYIHTALTIGHGDYTHREGLRPFENKTTRWERIGNHELYNFGHLLTAGCIHYRATGKTSLLNVAKNAGDYLHATFTKDDPELKHFGFNPSNIMGAVELYRTTGDKKYLELAQIFLDNRGSQRGGTDQNQDRTPLREETEAVGHAVTANYLYSGAADIYAETGEEAIYNALERIWENVTQKKMYVTGATGALHDGISSAGDRVHEAYGREYELPNTTAYNETCANIANAMWNWRMLNVTGEARFADIMELVLYNSGISGLSLDGKHFFYTNPLRRIKDAPYLSWDLPTRQSYLACFCCPPSLLRTIAKTRGWAYSISEKGVWVNLYGSNELDTHLPDGTPVSLNQETRYPWEGNIRMTVREPRKSSYSLMLRIPGWAEDVSVAVNGEKVNQRIQPGTYLIIDRTWRKGDIVELDIPMPAQLIRSNPLVESTKNQVAVKRGPVVYCLESPDLPDGISVMDVIIPKDIELNAVYNENVLGGVAVLEGKALLNQNGFEEEKLYHEKKTSKLDHIDIRLIPYFTWSNRGASEMTVWMRFTN